MAQANKENIHTSANTEALKNASVQLKNPYKTHKTESHRKTVWLVETVWNNRIQIFKLTPFQIVDFTCHFSLRCFCICLDFLTLWHFSQLPSLHCQINDLLVLFCVFAVCQPVKTTLKILTNCVRCNKPGILGQTHVQLEFISEH